jgi:hypothetical protein
LSLAVVAADGAMACITGHLNTVVVMLVVQVLADIEPEVRQLAKVLRTQLLLVVAVLVRVSVPRPQLMVSIQARLVLRLLVEVEVTLLSH